MSDLRKSVKWCLSLRCPWTHHDLAGLAGAPPDRAAAYLAILHRQGVVLRLEDGSWMPGAQAEEWRKTETRSRGGPGGGRRDFREKQQIRDRLRAADFAHATGRAEQAPPPAIEGLPPRRPRAGQMPGELRALIPLPLAAQTLGVSQMTMRRMVQRGDVRAVQWRKHGSIRIAWTELARLMAPAAGRVVAEA
jgi:hypothetical protein